MHAVLYGPFFHKTDRFPRTRLSTYGDRAFLVDAVQICNSLPQHITGLAVWLSGNALASINVVPLRQTRLVPGWVTVCRRVNHLGL